MNRSKNVHVELVRNGRGIVARRDFAAGQLVCRIRGKIVSAAAVWRYWDRDPQLAANCIRFDDEQFLNPHLQIGAFAGGAYAALAWRSGGLLAPLFAHLAVNVTMMLRAYVMFSQR